MGTMHTTNYGESRDASHGTYIREAGVWRDGYSGILGAPFAAARIFRGPYTLTFLNYWLQESGSESSQRLAHTSYPMGRIQKSFEAAPSATGQDGRAVQGATLRYDNLDTDFRGLERGVSSNLTLVTSISFYARLVVSAS
ncbi:hypothetical protein VTK73DRAFT_8242 [Phialemonium thermophilum]|uniref:Uncharacterized protein n=1 Tax=Phialemonium thermophilum TaxID=223376 RepID=A0ABR3XPV9_9PEZI